jgi:hypothetical protein
MLALVIVPDAQQELVIGEAGDVDAAIVSSGRFNRTRDTRYAA